MGINSGCKISAVGLGLSVGILCGLSLLIMGLLAHVYGNPFVAMNNNFLYLGFPPSIKTSFIGGIMGFVHGFVSGFLVAWLYNICSHCCCCNKN